MPLSRTDERKESDMGWVYSHGAHTEWRRRQEKLKKLKPRLERLLPGSHSIAGMAIMALRKEIASLEENTIRKAYWTYDAEWITNEDGSVTVYHLFSAFTYPA
jgi:hypothetical protein